MEVRNSVFHGIVLIMVFLVVFLCGFLMLNLKVEGGITLCGIRSICISLGGAGFLFLTPLEVIESSCCSVTDTMNCMGFYCLGNCCLYLYVL